MKKLLVLALVLSQVGCATYLVNEHQRGSIKRDRALQRALMDDAALKAYTHNGVYGMAFDVSRWDAFMAAPTEHIVAGVVDAGMVWGVYEALKWIDDREGGSKSDATVVNIQGDGNVTVLQGTETGENETSTQRDTATNNTQ